MKRTVKKAEERRHEIITASRELFLSMDYEKTTMQDVIDKLQIAKGTIYHYFKSKAELMEAVVQDMVDEYFAEVKKILQKSRGNALKKMQMLVAASQVKGNLEKVRDILHRPGNVGLHTHLLAVSISKLAPLYAQVIQQGCEEGIFQTEHPLECAELLLAGIQFITDVGCYPWKQEDLVRRALALPELMESLLRAPKGAFNFLLKS